MKERRLSIQLRPALNQELDRLTSKTYKVATKTKLSAQKPRKNHLQEKQVKKARVRPKIQ